MLLALLVSQCLIVMRKIVVSLDHKTDYKYDSLRYLQRLFPAWLGIALMKVEALN